MNPVIYQSIAKLEDHGERQKRYRNPFDGMMEALAKGVYEAPGQLGALFDEFSPIVRLANAARGSTLQADADELTGNNWIEYDPNQYQGNQALQGLARLMGNISGDPLNALPIGMVGKAGAKQVASTIADEAGRTTMRNQLGIIKNPLLDESAKAHFGRTFSPDETGYIMDDGMRLDFSGRHYATGYEKTPMGFKAKPGQPDYLRGSRGVDHRELGDLMEEGGTEAMLKFMDESGAVRYMPNTGITVTSTNLPSRRQIEQIVKDFRRSGETLYVDVDDINKGYSVASREFDRPTVDEVYEFIKSNQAASGEPLGNLGAFKSQLGAVDTPRGLLDSDWYHGTDKTFDVFDTSDKSSDFTIPNNLGDNIGAFFSAQKSDAKDFGKNVLKRKLNLSNPKIFESQEDFRDFMKANIGLSDDIRDADGYITKEGEPYYNTRKVLEWMGHDGVIIKKPGYNKKSDKPWAIAFDQGQIL